MKKYIIIGVTSLVVTLGGIFVFSKIKNKKEVDEKKNEEEEEKKKETTTTKSSGTSSKWVKESFPLKRWCKGDNVKKLQTALGVTADGYFGVATETALYNKTKTKTCSADLFRELTTEKTTKKVVLNDETYAPQIGTKIYANDNGVKVRNSYVIASGNILGQVANNVLIGTADQYKTVEKYRWVRVKLAHPKEMQNKTFKDTEAPEYGWVRGDVCYFYK